MIGRLAAHITAYIDYLRGLGLYITVHGEVQECLSQLTPYNFHDCPFCVLVKSDDLAWERCIESQRKIYERKTPEPWFGMCHGGVEEYIFPILGERMMGFVSVSGYGVDRERALRRIARLGRDFSLEESRLREIYDRQLRHDAPPLGEIRTIVEPLTDMLLFLCLLTPAREVRAEGQEVYVLALRYIGRHFMEDISLPGIAKACHCSESTLSHAFRRHSGQSVGQYITALRIAQAKKLLRTTRLPVKHIAALCGFSDPDYFSAAFRRTAGCSPTEYRDGASVEIPSS